MSANVLFGNFNGTLNGQGPNSGLTLSKDLTKFYGCTLGGGTYNNGVVFTINVDGSDYSVLYEFNTDPGYGYYPQGTLALSLDGDILYGTTSAGNNNNGILYSIDLSNNFLHVLHQFNGGNGSNANSGVTLSPDGTKLYGTTNEGGPSGVGVIFSYDISSNIYNYYPFDTSINGQFPNAGILTSIDGSTLYGTTTSGGANGYGVIYKIDSNVSSNYQILHSFGSGTDGQQPQGTLNLSSNGLELYGTTFGGGSNLVGTIFTINTDGTDYQIVYNFQGSNDGANPACGLTYVTEELFYGTTFSGGNFNSGGTIFELLSTTTKLGTTYTLKTLYQFTPEFENPSYGITFIPGDRTKLYGTTFGVSGEKYSNGAIYLFDIYPPHPPPPPPNPTICFGEGTKILCLVNGKQKYIPIEDIEEGTLVKTYKDGYKAVVINARGKLYNTPEQTINKLYKLPVKTITNKKGSSELIEDLYVTGSHALLHDKLTPTQLENMAALSVYIENNYDMPAYDGMIHDKYKLIAYYNENFEEVNDDKVYNIYHLLLESDNMFKNYAIYANGILAESADEYSFLRFSNFEKINQKPDKERKTKHLTNHTKKMINF